VARRVAERGEQAADELTNDPDRQLGKETRVRVAVRLPNRWPAHKAVPLARWADAVDRRDGVTLWDDSDILVCSPPRGEFIGAPPGA
jgi:hypothetical protein